MTSSHEINTMTAHLFRENSGKMVAVLSRIFGLNNIDVVIDVVQDTFESALTKWKFNGVPENPAGWLMQVAKNKAINTFKRESKNVSLSDSVFAENSDYSFELQIDQLLMPNEIEDSQLRLLLVCCHPDISEKNQVIITLHILCGFGVAEIANALLMKDEAVKKAITRTKAELKKSGNILQTHLPLKYEKRIGIVQTILYLMFNEGYKTTRSKEIINNELCYEAIRLTKLLVKNGVSLINESNALLALMFLNLSRFPSRLSSNGELVTLKEQDRTRWNKTFIEEGFCYLKNATVGNKISCYHLEAIIASLHCSSQTFEKTDWKTIVYLYKQLESTSPSAMITLNRLIAESYISNSLNSIHELEKLKQDPSIHKHYLLYAAEGDLLNRTGKRQAAKAAFTKAFDLATSSLDKLFLQNKIKSLSENQIQIVSTFQDLLSAPFHETTNAICWNRKLKGDFSEIVQKIESTGNITVIDEKMLLEFDLSEQGKLARETLLNDLNVLKANGASPVLNLIKYYDRDNDHPFFPTDVYSFHIDRSPVPTDTFLCTYYGETSEILPNSQAEQKILVPEIREQLEQLYHGNDEGFELFLREHFFDLHYQAKSDSNPISLGRGNMWKLAVDHTESNVLPCIHRAPEEKPGESRLLMIC